MLVQRRVIRLPQRGCLSITDVIGFGHCSVQLFADDMPSQPFSPFLKDPPVCWPAPHTAGMDPLSESQVGPFNARFRRHLNWFSYRLPVSVSIRRASSPLYASSYLRCRAARDSLQALKAQSNIGF
jgi:hypothetical protein